MERLEYFKIGDKDFSKYVNELSIQSNINYNAQTNAAGNTVVDYINTKRQITVGFIHIDAAAMLSLQSAIDSFSVSLSFRNPNTNTLEENVACIIPSNEIGYYTIQQNRVMYNEFTLTFIEL